MTEHLSTRHLFSQIAEAIRAKTGSSADIIADDFPDAIALIPTDPSGSCTATAADLVLGKTAYSQNQLITGTLTSYIKEVTSVPTTYDTAIIHDTTTDKYYLWRT